MESKDFNFLSHFITEEVYITDNTPSQDNSIAHEAENATNSEILDKTISNDEEKETLLKLNYIGGNKKGILVLVNYPHDIPTTESELLFKILSAIKLDKEAIALINLGQNQSPKQHAAINELSFDKIIAFGTDCEILYPQTLENYQLTEYQNKKVLRSHSLNEIGADINKKKYLWTALQKAFQS